MTERERIILGLSESEMLLWWGRFGESPYASVGRQCETVIRRAMVEERIGRIQAALLIPTPGESEPACPSGLASAAKSLSAAGAGAR